MPQMMLKLLFQRAFLLIRCIISALERRCRHQRRADSALTLRRRGLAGLRRRAPVGKAALSTTPPQGVHWRHNGERASALTERWYRLSTSQEELLRRVELLETQEARLHKLYQKPDAYTDLLVKMRATKEEEGEIRQLFQKMTLAVRNGEEIGVTSLSSPLRQRWDQPNCSP